MRPFIRVPLPRSNQTKRKNSQVGGQKCFRDHNQSQYGIMWNKKSTKFTLYSHIQSVCTTSAKVNTNYHNHTDTKAHISGHLLSYTIITHNSYIEISTQKMSMCDSSVHICVRVDESRGQVRGADAWKFGERTIYALYKIRIYKNTHTHTHLRGTLRVATAMTRHKNAERVMCGVSRAPWFVISSWNATRSQEDYICTTRRAESFLFLALQHRSISPR